MGESSFDLIAQEMLKQKHNMEKLMAENRELRRQLAALRAGQGVFVEIYGQRIELNLLMEGATATNNHQPLPTQEQSTGQNVVPTAIVDAPTVATTSIANPPAIAATAIVDSPTVATTALTEPTDPRTPIFPATTPVTPRKREEEKEKTTTSFLEEMMVDEFSAAMTSPLAVWTGPIKQPEITDEEKKAALRKELMGSFLLE